MELKFIHFAMRDRLHRSFLIAGASSLMVAYSFVNHGGSPMMWAAVALLVLSTSFLLRMYLSPPGLVLSQGWIHVRLFPVISFKLPADAVGDILLDGANVKFNVTAPERVLPKRFGSRGFFLVPVAWFPDTGLDSLRKAIAK